MTSRRVAVMAHFDPGAQVAPHVRRFVGQLLQACDEVTLVSTSGVGDDGRAWASEQPRLCLIERENVGYDFVSYATGLAASKTTADTEVVFCNDSFVGLTVPIGQVWQRMQASRADFWGMTQSTELGRHVQSYFLVCRPQVVASAAFADFWAGVAVLPDKWAVVREYEVGFSQRLTEAGFTGAAYFTLNPLDWTLGQARNLWWRDPGAFERHPVLALTPLSWVRGRGDEHLTTWNAATMCADAVFTGRLPLVKLQVLRDDPAALGADGLLAACVRTFPDAFAGVADYLARAASCYDANPARELPTPRLRQAFARLRYRTPTR